MFTPQHTDNLTIPQMERGYNNNEGKEMEHEDGNWQGNENEN